MITGFKSLRDIDTFKGLERPKLSRYARIVNTIFATSVSGHSLSSASSAPAMNRVDLACRRIRKTKTFDDALDVALQVKKGIVGAPNYQSHMHLLGEALIDRSVKDFGLNKLHERAKTIAHISDYTVGTEKIIRSKIGQILEKKHGSLESQSSAYRKSLIKEHKTNAEFKEKYFYLKTKLIKYDLASTAEQYRINFQYRTLFKDIDHEVRQFERTLEQELYFNEQPSFSSPLVEYGRWQEEKKIALGKVRKLAPAPKPREIKVDASRPKGLIQMAPFLGNLLADPFEDEPETVGDIMKEYNFRYQHQAESLLEARLAAENGTQNQLHANAVEIDRRLKKYKDVEYPTMDDIYATIIKNERASVDEITEMLTEEITTETITV